MSDRLLFIVNPKAGRTKSRTPLFDATAAFCRSGYTVNVQLTSGCGDAERLAREQGGEYELIACSGGDGTLSETINGVMRLAPEKRPLVAYLPGGSTNDFASSLHISSQPEEAAKSAMHGKITTLDIGKFNEQYFAYVAAFGAFTRTSYRVRQDIKNMLGHTAYLLDSVKDLDTLHSYSVRITADDEVLDGDYLFGAVANSTSIAGIMKLSGEDVQMDDGRFELMLIPSPKSPLQLQTLLHALLFQEYTSDAIVFRHVSSVRVESEKPLSWSLDGEFAPGAPRVDISVEHNALNLLI